LETEKVKSLIQVGGREGSDSGFLSPTNCDREVRRKEKLQGQRSTSLYLFSLSAFDISRLDGAGRIMRPNNHSRIAESRPSFKDASG
jgi:hypothetical protein